MKLINKLAKLLFLIFLILLTCILLFQPELFHSIITLWVIMIFFVYWLYKNKIELFKK